jgi:hypothetical protein
VEQKASLCLCLPVMRKEMTESKAIIVLTTTLLVTCASIGVSGAADQQDAVKSAVDKAIQPVMEKYEIPGMAVGITVGGKHYVLDYGVASTKNPQARHGQHAFRDRISQQDIHGDAGILGTGQRSTLLVG